MAEPAKDPISERRSVIRRHLEQLSMLSAHGKKEIMGKLVQGRYDSSIAPLFEDVTSDGVDSEMALESLAKVLNEPVPTMERRSRKPVDRTLVGITDSPTSKPKFERSYCCGVCFQSEELPDQSCDVCGLAVHSTCGQFEGTEAPAQGQASPFRVDYDKGAGKMACGYCRATRKMSLRGVKDIQKPGNVVCEFCNHAALHTLLTNLSGAPTKWVHVCCARFLPGSSIGITGAKRYTGADKDKIPCSICNSQSGIVTKCVMCDEEIAANVHVYCALSQGGYGIRPLDPLHPSKRLLCPQHKTPNSNNHNKVAEAMVPNVGLLPIVESLQFSHVPKGCKSIVCGVCLQGFVNEAEPVLSCEGCDVRMHPACYEASRTVSQIAGEPFRLAMLDSDKDFFCIRCEDRSSRGTVGNCALCPHASTYLALQRMPNGENAHSLCLCRTPDEVLMNLAAGEDQNPASDSKKCSICHVKAGAMIDCHECGVTFHAMCLSLVCEESRNLPFSHKIATCLAHCGHSHPATCIAPVVVENHVGTAARTFKRPISAVMHEHSRENSGQSAYAIRQSVSILPEWTSLPLQTRNQLLAQPLVSASEPVEIPDDLVERALGAIARAWDQTKAEAVRKRAKMLGIPIPPSSASPEAGYGRSTSGGKYSGDAGVQSTNGVSTRSSGRSTRRNFAMDDGGPSQLRAHDAPIEVQEVWPLLEPLFRKPGSTIRLVELLERDRAADAMLLAPGNNCPLPPFKLFADQPPSANPFVPPRFEKHTPLERSRVDIMPISTLRLGSFRDAGEFAARRCCLGRRRIESDFASLNLQIVRGMGLPSHLFLMHHGRDGAVDGMSHCTYLENETTRVAFIKISACAPIAAFELFVASMRSTLAPKDAEIHSVYISSITPQQENGFWQVVFPNRMVKVPFDNMGDVADPLMTLLQLRGWNWFEHLGMFLASPLATSVELVEALATSFVRNPIYPEPAADDFRANLQLFVEPKQAESINGVSSSALQSPPTSTSRVNWAYTFRLEHPTPACVPPPGPRFALTHSSHLLSNIATGGSYDIPMNDANLPNTLSKQIEHLQKELTKVCAMNDRNIELLKMRIAEDQMRMKLIQRAEVDEKQYRERKRKLDERMVAVRLQAERDAMACCYICRDDESYRDNPIIICERCSTAAHQRCLGLPAVPEDDWYCDKCVGKVGTDVPLRRGRGRPPRRKIAGPSRVKKQVPIAGGQVRVSDTASPPYSPVRDAAQSSVGVVRPCLSEVRVNEETTDGEKPAEATQTHCICGSTDEGLFMLFCDSCTEWFHSTCIGLTDCQHPDAKVHPNCVVLDGGEHTFDVADWTFKCPKCSQTGGVPMLVKNARSRRGNDPLSKQATSQEL